MGSTITVALGAKPRELSCCINGRAPMSLRPAYSDVFVGPNGSGIRFIRDSSGKIVALSAGEARVWDLRFNRVR